MNKTGPMERIPLFYIVRFCIFVYRLLTPSRPISYSLFYIVRFYVFVFRVLTLSSTMVFPVRFRYWFSIIFVNIQDKFQPWSKKVNKASFFISNRLFWNGQLSTGFFFFLFCSKSHLSLTVVLPPRITHILDTLFSVHSMIQLHSVYPVNIKFSKRLSSFPGISTITFWMLPADFWGLLFYLKCLITHIFFLFTGKIISISLYQFFICEKIVQHSQCRVKWLRRI